LNRQEGLVPAIYIAEVTAKCKKFKIHIAYNFKMASRSSGADSVPALKLRIKELEAVVNDYKKKLDDLRKAKSTTITKREREVVSIAGLGSRRESIVPKDHGPDPQIAQLQRENDMLRKKHEALIESQTKHQKREEDPQIKELQRENELLRQKHDALLESQMERSKSFSNDETDHVICEEEMAKLQHINICLHSDNATLCIESSDLKQRVEELSLRLSIKEAEWCEEEEKLHLKMQMSFGEKYAEWMQKTEQKIEELTHTNQVLQSYLRRQRPADPDPTGQDDTPGSS